MSDSLMSPWIVACQASLSMGFFRTNARVGCHFLLQGIFLTKNWTHVSCFAGKFFIPEPLGKPFCFALFSVKFWLNS